MRFGKLAPALVFGLALAAVASPARVHAAGGPATVTLDSVPPGARVVVRGHTVGRTPARIQVPAGRRLEATLHKKGFKPERVRLPRLRPGQVRAVQVRLRRR